MSIPLMSDQAVEAIAACDRPGLLFREPDHDDPISLQVGLRIGTQAPEPQGRYWESSDGRYWFYYNTVALPEQWYAPWRWWVKILEVERADGGWYEKTVAMRWCDLRREAKEEALGWWKAYEAGELDLDGLREELDAA